MEANYVINRIRLGLDGRGVWEHHLHCPDVPDYSETGTYAEDIYREAKNDISSVATLPAGLNVNYRAGNQVYMGPGFHATAGVAYHAFIHPCDIPGNSFHPKNMHLSESEEQEEATDYPTPTLLAFPNPSNGSLTVLANDLSTVEEATLSLIDATGRVVLERPMRGPLMRLDVPTFDGLYTVLVQVGELRLTTRVVIN